MFEMLDIHFPIAHVNLNSVIVVLIGFASGFASGIFGIGGGLISTPLLIMMGVPSAVAVATSAHQIIGATFSGVLARIGTKNYDLKLGAYLSLFSIIGSGVGMYVFLWFKGIGNLDFLISWCYVVVMTILSVVTAINIFVHKNTYNSNGYVQSMMRMMPMQLKFAESGVRVSLVFLIGAGLVIGVLSSIMGVGGGFIAVPVLTYLFGVEYKTAVGTSLIQILMVTIFIIAVHVFKTGSLDILLGTLLIVGAVFGSQIGSAIGMGVKNAKVLPLLMLLLMLAIATKFSCDLFLVPSEMYEVQRA